MSQKIAACPEELLNQALSLFERDDQAGLQAIEDLSNDYDRDPVLHFLRGSLLGSVKRYDEAGQAMARALEIAPDYALARFQFGFLRLSSGDAEAARQIWGPLDALPAGDPLRLFADGLNLLARDQFEDAKVLLNRGLEASTNGPMNSDVRLILDGLDNVKSTDEADPTSPTDFLLAQQAARRTVH